MMTAVRFGKVESYQNTVPGNWEFKVSGQDIQANRQLVEKYGRPLPNSPEPTYELDITAHEYSGHYGLSRSAPLITKIADQEPASDELVLISNLLDTADKDASQPLPQDGSTSRFSDLWEGLFTVALKQLKKQAGGAQGALKKVADLLEQPFVQISRCCK